MISLSAKQRLLLLTGLLPVFANLLIYSVTWGFVWDEGFHLVAAQLIAAGKTPYIDFCFPQTPLNAYFNAGLLILFGNNWHVVHLAAAVFVCAAVWLAADFVLTRMPPQATPLACALTTAALFGVNVVVLHFGPVGQAYAVCMLLVTAAFRVSLPVIGQRHVWSALLAGLLASAAAGSSLLAAPVAPVLLLWIFFRNKEGGRVGKALAFTLGCAVPFAPVIRLYLLGPRQTLFNVVQYQALFRRINWGDANLRDFDTLTSWLASPDALILAALFTAALIFLWSERHQDDPTLTASRRAEFYLAGALAIAESAFASVTHPSFERYFVLAVPFICIVCGPGLWAAGSRLVPVRYSAAPAAVVIALTALIWGRDLFDQRDDEHWSDYEEVASKVAEVTPLDGRLFGDELVYFLLQRTPPSGMEFSYSHRLDLPADQEKLFHIISMKHLQQQLKAGTFRTLQTCRDSLVDDYEPAKWFKHHADPSDCDVFWEPKANLPSGK